MKSAMLSEQASLSSQGNSTSTDNDDWPRRYDDAVQFLQRQSLSYIERAEKAEANVAEGPCAYARLLEKRRHPADCKEAAAFVCLRCRERLCLRHVMIHPRGGRGHGMSTLPKQTEWTCSVCRLKFEEIVDGKRRICPRCRARFVAPAPVNCKKAVRCAYFWERKPKGLRYVTARGQCTRLTAHPSRYCKPHRYSWLWTEEQEAAYRKSLATA